MDADQIASITGGTWEKRPPPLWRYRGIRWHQSAAGVGRMVIAKADGFRYGVDLTTLKAHEADAGIVVDREGVVRSTAPVLRVASTATALRRLASHVRANTTARIVAVTGSVGKTSTCHLLGLLLRTRGRVVANGQLNYPDGIVCATANLDEAPHAVIEAALQGLGEATAILKPHVAVLTNISPVHLAEVGTLLALAEKKASLFRDLAPGGTAVINRDIPYFERVLEIARASASSVLTFGAAAGADFRLLGYDPESRQVLAQALGTRISFTLGLPGRHMAANALGVLAALQAIGIDWQPLLAGCAGAEMVAGRGSVERLKLAGGVVTLIDDSYNASPAAMAAAFAILGATSPGPHGRRIAVLGDMLELGPGADDYHERLAQPLIASGVDRVFLGGTCMRRLWGVLPSGMKASVSGEPAALLRPLLKELSDGDVVLVKGSHDTGVAWIADALRYASLAPDWYGAGPTAIQLALTMTRRLAPHTPRTVRDWVAWQIDKLVKRRQAGGT